MHINDILIEEVKKRRCLYDSNDPDYNSTTHKWKLWDEIAAKLGMRPNVAKLRWKSMRDAYIKFKRRQNEPGLNGKKRNTYHRAGKLTFLDGAYENITPRLKLKKKDLINPSPSVSLMSSVIEDPISTSGIQSRTRPVLSDDDDENVADFALCKRKRDDIDYLFASYIETFRKLSQKKQFELKIELAKLFSMAELEDM